MSLDIALLLSYSFITTVPIAGLLMIRAIRVYRANRLVLLRINQLRKRRY
jgi:hypothetical protein